MVKTLAEVLNQNLAKRGWNFERLAKEAGLPRNTVYRWTRGEVRRVRHWQDLVKAAQALDLNRSQTNAHLEIGGHPSIGVLLERTTNEEDRELLSRWSRSTPNNLPAQLTSFVGRLEELERLTSTLASARLVTLTGPGGSGKTRLALEAARTMLDAFEEVCFVDLAPVRDPDLVILSICEALNLRESQDEPPLLALRAHLRDRKVLLVLDNFEQVIEAAPLVTELLRCTNRVKALVTSRMRLNVRGEHELEVPPLPLPGPAASFEQLSRNPAVALFADRARAIEPTFELIPGSAPLVAEVCARMEGLPLGIELAAARTRQVRLGSMLAQFTDRLGLASAGPRDAPDRQRTLRSTIAWSYNLLEPGARSVLTCASVFAGGFTQEAVGSVTAAIGQPEVEVSEGLESLVEQNLLRRIWGVAGEPRYEMLETIREYALEKLEEAEQVEAIAGAASEYFLGLVERADLEGEGQACWLPRLIAEHDNFQATLGWCRQRGQIEAGLALCMALMPLWQVRDHQLEARTWLDAFMTAEDDVPPGLKARGLLWQGLLLLRGTGDDATSSRLFEEARVLFRDCGDLNGASEALQAEGDVYRNQGEWQLANRRYAESLELGLQSNNAYVVAHGHMGLGLCAQEMGTFDDAEHDWQLTLEWAEKAANKATVALALNSLGELARYREDWEEAERYYEQTLRLAKELGSEFRMALALHNLGYVSVYSGEPEKAQRIFKESLSLYEGRQYDKGIAECLAGLGKVAALEGRLERAARLCGAMEAILESLGARLDTLDRADYERTLGTLRDQLGERLELLVHEGRTMSMEKAVKHATADRCTTN